MQSEVTRIIKGQNQTTSSPNYHYGNSHRRSDSIDLGRRGSAISMLSLQQSTASNSNTPPTSPQSPQSPQNQYRQSFAKQRHSLEQLQSSLDFVPEAQTIDLDEITREFRRQERALHEAEINWFHFLKEMPVETPWRPNESNVNLPETSEMLLNKYNSEYNISNNGDSKHVRETALRRALGRFRNSSRALGKVRVGSNRDEGSR
ncbi:hypothetical protein KGF57_000846 [Candida theae]|uniref:Uncharacterized protein n=1 Tax=Candida theae TaxID=1198502 RepID=A0AAD5G0A7_9ASCO|nr:uncharacterized protein KGF57_000846 [Candida theae]KAI5965053.1 hypothetical protein KGF57_000846 [Candida theae]